MDENPRPEDFVNFLQSSKFYEFDYSSAEKNIVSVILVNIAKKNLRTCKSKLATFQLHHLWTPRVRVAFSISFLRRKLSKAVKCILGSR